MRDRAKKVNGKKYNVSRSKSVIYVEKPLKSYIDSKRRKIYHIINKTNRQDARYV